MEQSRLCEGETILIHDAASAVGQAALSIAQTIGADIWTTVKNVSEKALLMREFGVLEDKVLYAGTEGFAETIREATHACGMDVVFDTLTESRLNHATCDTLAEFGRYISIDACRRRSASTKANVSMISVDMIALSKYRPRVFQRTLSDVARMLKSGQLHPIYNTEVYAISDVVAALHNVEAAGPHGKVVVVPQDDDLVMVSDAFFLRSYHANSKGTTNQQASCIVPRGCDIHPDWWHGWSWPKYDQVDGVQGSEEHRPSFAQR
jgi:NADPH:quinone reductase-like Zn-dependent oxidoreductase